MIRIKLYDGTEALVAGNQVMIEGPDYYIYQVKDSHNKDLMAVAPRDRVLIVLVEG